MSFAVIHIETLCRNVLENLLIIDVCVGEWLNKMFYWKKRRRKNESKEKYRNRMFGMCVCWF